VFRGAFWCLAFLSGLVLRFKVFGLEWAWGELVSKMRLTLRKLHIEERCPEFKIY